MVAFARAANIYRTVQVESARPARVLDDLYARCLEDCAGARAAIAAKDPGKKGQLLDHALRIVSELNAALEHDRAPDLCQNLSALYGFVQNRLIKANVEQNATLVLEAERILTSLREGFQKAAART